MTGELKGLGSRAIKGAFFKRLNEIAQAAWTSRLANIFTSDQESETYAFLGDSPAMTEWIGPRTMQQLKDYDFEVKNRKFSNGIPIDEDDFRRDKTGQIIIRINELAKRAAALPQKELSILLNNGGTGLAYDGVAFYATSHTNENGDTINNAITQVAATGVIPTTQEMEDGILKTIEAMLGYKDDAGEPVNEDSNTFALMLPVALWKQTMAALKNDFTSAGVSNTLRSTNFTITPILNARLSSSAACFMFNEDTEVKSLVWQDEVQTVMSELGVGSDYHTLNDKRAFFAKRVGNGGYGRYSTTARLTFT